MQITYVGPHAGVETIVSEEHLALADGVVLSELTDADAAQAAAKYAAQATTVEAKRGEPIDLPDLVAAALLDDRVGGGDWLEPADAGDVLAEQAEASERAAAEAAEQPEVVIPAPEPWAGYGEQTAAEVIELIGDLDADGRAGVIAYERAHQNRVTVLRAAADDDQPADEAGNNQAGDAGGKE